jgi:hypothetical protein
LAHADNGDCAAARPLLTWLDHHVPSDFWVRNVVELARITVLAYVGQLEEARTFLTESLAGHLASDGLRRAGDLPLAAAVGCWMADVGLCQRAAEAAERTPAAGLFALILKDVPEILHALVRDDVEAALRRATAGLHEEAFGGHHLWIRCESGQMALTLGDLSHAEAAVASILPHLDDAGLYFVRVSTYVLWSQLAAARGEQAEAESRAHDAVACASERELHLLLVDALETLAVVLADSGRAAEAARLLGATEAFRVHSAYQWRYPHQRRAIESLRGHVDPAYLAEGRAPVAARSRRVCAAWPRRTPAPRARLGKLDGERAPGRRARGRRSPQP